MRVLADNAIPFLENRFPEDVELILMPGKEISKESLKDVDALIVRTRTRCDENLLKDSNVKLVATATIGTDHIDIPWCENNGIIVRSAPGCNAPGVAQYVLSSLFKAGFNPATDVLGIIGYGNVGATVGKWCRELGIKTLVNDPPRQLAGCRDVEYVSKDELLRKSDAVTLHVPMTFGGSCPTFHFIGEKELQMMKKGAILVNSSRGGVVDEGALKNAVRGQEMAVVVDVWEGEPKIDSTLVDLALISTPHIAGYSEQGKRRATRMALEAVSEVLGIKVNLSGLECIPINDAPISRKMIEESYDPTVDSLNLKKDISRFEDLRNSYRYRREPLF